MNFYAFFTTFITQFMKNLKIIDILYISLFNEFLCLLYDVHNTVYEKFENN